MSTNDKRIQELEAMKHRIEHDLRRVNSMGEHIGPNEPLTRNYKNTLRELQELKKTEVK
jgi:hypothetical protein